MDILFIGLTIASLIFAIYQADKNKNKDNKTLIYKISKFIANSLNFITFLDTEDVNNIINDIESNK